MFRDLAGLQALHPEPDVAVAGRDGDEVVVRPARSRRPASRPRRDELRRVVEVAGRVRPGVDGRRVGVRDLRRPRLVVADVDLRVDRHRAACPSSRRRSSSSRCSPSGDEKSGTGFGVRVADRVLVLAEAAHREALPDQVLVGAAEAGQVGREHRVARVDHRRAARHQHHRVVVVLDPAPVARAVRRGSWPRTHAMSVGRSRCDGYRCEEAGPAGRICDRDPDLAVGVHLGPGQVEAEVAEVERIGVGIAARAPGSRRPSAGPRGSRGCRCTGCRSRTRPRCSGRSPRTGSDVELVQVLERVEVAERLAHRAGVRSPGAAPTPLPIMRFSIMWPNSWPMTPKS